MPSHSVSAIARQLSQQHGVTIAPHVISTLFYKRRLDDTRCPVVGGHRLIPDDYISAIEQALRDTGVLPPVEAPSA